MTTYALPDGPELEIRHERRHRPLDGGRFYILFELTAPLVENPERRRPPLNLSFVVDRSGSMGGGKLELAKQGVEHALRLLDERDSVSVVVYDDQIDCLLSQRRFDRDARANALRRLGRTLPRGSTDLAGGWLTGCDQLAAVADGSSPLSTGAGDPVCQTVLLTDGLANVGITDEVEIAHHADELKRRGITTHTFGVGGDFNEELLGRMADAGGGRFVLIDDISTIPNVFANLLGDILELALRDVVLTLTVPSGWQVSLLNDLPLLREDNRLVVRLGDLSSREMRPLVWEVQLPAARAGQEERLEVRLRWSDPSGTRDAEQHLGHALIASHEPGAVDERVMDAVATMLGGRARAEAAAHNRAGNYPAAHAAVMHYADIMPATATGAAEARALREEVAPMMAAPTDRLNVKRQYAQARDRFRKQRDYTKRQQ
jgi:Ca-activated chloride channel family protein